MLQNVRVETDAGNQIVVSCSPDQFIRSEQDIVDILVVGHQSRTNLFLLADTNFVSEFYDLKSGLAGGILQKASNYSAKLAIVGSFEMIGGNRFRELMSESNKGSQVRFTDSREDAISWLVR